MFLETFGQRDRLVMLRDESLNRLLNRLFMAVHQSLETNFRQVVLLMNRLKHLLDVLQQAFAVSLGGVKRRQKLDLTDQMRPAKLKKRFVLFSVLQIGRVKITADTSGKIFAKRFHQNLAAPRSVDLEKRKTFRNKTPRPLQLAVLFETRFINVKMILLFQKFFKFLVRRLESDGHFFDLFHEKAGRKINPDTITKVFLERSIRNVTPTFEIGGECGHVWPEQSGFFDVVRQLAVVPTLTMFAPIHELMIFCSEKWFFDKFDLLCDFRFALHEIEFVPAIRARGEFELDDFVDQFRRKWFAKILFVAWLSTAFEFAFPFIFAFGLGSLGRFDNIGGRRFGRGCGIFFEDGDTFLELGIFFQCRLK